MDAKKLFPKRPPQRTNGSEAWPPDAPDGLFVGAAKEIGRVLGRRRGPIGIEFRDGLARIVQVAVDRRSDVLASAIVAYDEDAPGWAAEQIAHAVRGFGFRGDRCVVGLPADVVRTETCIVPDGTRSEIRAALAARARDLHGLEQADIDWIPLVRGEAADDGRLEVAAVFADRNAVEAIVHPLIDVGLLPDAVEPSFVAVARACSRTFRRASDAGRVRVAIDLQSRAAVATVLRGTAVVSARTVSTLEELAPAVLSMLADVRKVFADATAREIRLVGVGAYRPEPARALERATGLTVRLDDEQGTLDAAFERIGVHAQMTRDGGTSGGAAAWAGALGLAFRPCAASDAEDELRDVAAERERTTHRRKAA
jgi:hypothetical protein